MATNAVKIDQLTFTRFLAAIAIVVFHFGKYYFPFNIGILSQAFNNASLCVSYFFVLSGFIMVIAYDRFKKVDFKKYYINRLSRIYPVYFLAFILTVIFTYLVSKIELTGISLQLLLLQAWVPKYAIAYNMPGWSLSVEGFFYLLFPILYNYLYSKYSLKRIFTAVLIFWIGSQTGFYLIGKYIPISFFAGIFGNPVSNCLFYLPFFHLNEFLMGNAAGLLFLNMIAGNIKIPVVAFKRGLLVLMAIVIIILYLVPNLKSLFSINLHNGLLAILFIPFILWLSLSTGPYIKILASKPLVFLGNISYEIYILQLPVFAFLALLNHKLKLGDAAFFYCSFIVLIIFSAVCHVFIEKPLLRLIRKYC